MIRNYLLVAWRNMTRNKLYFIINIIGLSVGLTATLLAAVFILDELSFDQFHSRKGQLYRLNKIVTEADGSTRPTAESSGLMGPTLRDEYPEVAEITRYLPWFDEVILFRDDKNAFLDEGDFVFADSTFFTVFDFNLLRGDPSTVLTRPATVVLTPQLSKTLFGQEDPIGKSITGFNNVELEVTGIAEAAPRNSHIQYDAITSWGTSEQMGFTFMNNWIAQGVTTYIQLGQGSDPNALEQKLPDFMRRHMPTRVDQYKLYLQPFEDLYLGSTEMFSRMPKQGSREFIYMFCIVTLLVLIIACINYINISTSKATRRAQEVGLRKTLGAGKSQLIRQFLGESLLVVMLAGFIALLLTDLTIPLFNELTGRSLESSLLLDARVFIFLGLVIVAVGIISGSYPAFLLSTFMPTDVLKSSARGGTSGNWARSILITFQFALSVTLIAGVLIVNEQIRFVLKKNLGFDKAQVIILPMTQNLQEKRDVISEQVRSLSSVESVSMCRDALGTGHSSTMVIPEGMNDILQTKMFRVDGNWQKTFRVKMAEGRFFDYRLASDSNTFIVNQAFVDQAGWTQPLERTVRFEGDSIQYSLIGVIEDFNYSSLRSAVEPLIMWISPGASNIAIRYQGTETRALLDHLEALWKENEPRYPFTYYFLDEQFASMYQSEEKLFRTVLVFAVLSILLACLGLYGMVSYTLEQRTKEIGIRKVMGARISDIAIMVNKQFIFMICIASIMAVPVALMGGNQWLDKYAFHIDVDPTVFIVALLITLAITVISVTVQSIRAASVNPIKSLRQE